MVAILIANGAFLSQAVALERMLYVGPYVGLVLEENGATALQRQVKKQNVLSQLTKLYGLAAFRVST